MEFKKVYLGNDEISKIYLGDVLVYEKTILPGDVKFIFVGDSIIRPDGWADATFDKMGIPYVNHWVGNEQAIDFLNDFDSKTALIADLESGEYTHVIVGHGFADANNYDAPVIKTNLDLIFNKLSSYGLTVYKTTISPSSTSTDQWATAENQSLNPGNPEWDSWINRRNALNVLIRNDSTYDGIIDLADEMEVNSSNVLTREGGLFLTNGVANWATLDGIHLNPGIIGVISDTIQPGITNLLLNPIIKPEAPTGGIVDNTAKTFDWINNPEYTSISDYEYTLNSGTSYALVTQKPVYVGNENKSIGEVGVRIKASSGRHSSGTLYNTEPFTADELPIPGYSYLSLPSAQFTDNGDLSYTSIGEVDMGLDKEMLGDGGFAIFNENPVGNIVGLYLIDESQANYIQLSLDFNSLEITSSSGNASYPDFNVGNYAVLARESGVWKLYKSSDGINLTEIITPAVPQVSGLTQLGIYANGTIYKPQTKGITNL